MAAILQTNPFLRKSELLDGILAGVDVGGDDTDGCKHGHATVVELTVAHLQRILVQAGGAAAALAAAAAAAADTGSARRGDAV